MALHFALNMLYAFRPAQDLAWRNLGKSSCNFSSSEYDRSTVGYQAHAVQSVIPLPIKTLEVDDGTTFGSSDSVLISHFPSQGRKMSLLTNGVNHWEVIGGLTYGVGFSSKVE